MNMSARHWVLIVAFLCGVFFAVYSTARAQVANEPLVVLQASSTPPFLQESSVAEREVYSQNERIIYELKQMNAHLNAIQKRI